MTLPTNLATVSDVRLAALDHACEVALKKEIDRVCETNARFRRLLSEALTVEEEIERRKGETKTPTAL